MGQAARSTLADIARAAGVSPATVDRALNNREGVHARTRAIVLQAARRLGYLPEETAADAADPAPLAFLLPAGTNRFIHNLGAQIEAQAAARPDVTARVEMIEGFDPQTLASRIASLPEEVRGLGLVAIDHPLVREAVRALVARGTAVVTLASDIHNVPRLAYVGIDNRQAGRLAAYLTGRFHGAGRPGKVALFAGSLAYRGHEEREAGFRHALAEMFPELAIVALREIRDDRTRAREEALALLRQHPDLSAIYNVGGGASGIAAAIAETGRTGSVTVIAHELTEATKAALLAGSIDALIDQNPRVEAREALAALSAAARGEVYRVIQPRIQVVFRENIPDD
jgi:LacI family transcriptional regulator